MAGGSPSAWYGGRYEMRDCAVLISGYFCQCLDMHYFCVMHLLLSPILAEQ